MEVVFLNSAETDWGFQVIIVRNCKMMSTMKEIEQTTKPTHTHTQYIHKHVYI